MKGDSTNPTFYRTMASFWRLFIYLYIYIVEPNFKEYIFLGLKQIVPSNLVLKIVVYAESFNVCNTS
jgi:hypothetical protein